MGLHSDSDVDPAQLMEAVLRDQPPAARRDTERFLAGAEHTLQQLRAYLDKRKYHMLVIDDILHWAERTGLVDDHRYASIFIRSHSRNSPMGNFRIRMELRKRGVSDSIIDELLSLREEDDLRCILVKTVRSKYGNLERDKALRRSMSYLQRRGFQYDMIRRIVNEALADPEEQEH